MKHKIYIYISIESKIWKRAALAAARPGRKSPWHQVEIGLLNVIYPETLRPSILRYVKGAIKKEVTK